MKILIVYLLIINIISCSKDKTYIDERVSDIANSPVIITSVIDSMKICPDPLKPDFSKFKINIDSTTHFGDIKTAQTIKNIIRSYNLYVIELENTLNCYKSLLNNENENL